MAYHQPNESGHISPRKLVKAQQKIAFEHNGCKFINGHAKSIEKEGDEFFNVTVAKYSENDEICQKKKTKSIVVTKVSYSLIKGYNQNKDSGINETKQLTLFRYFKIPV